jgi:hypothetical protein
MSNIPLIVGVTINILTSLAPRIPKKSSILPELLFKKYYLAGSIVGLYYLSFLIIIFSHGNIFAKVGICIALHFLINPILSLLIKRP